MAHGSPNRIWNEFPSGQSVKPGQFGRMFPHLLPFRPSDAALTALGNAMKEAAGSENDPAGDIPTLPAGFTYLGQFIDHDITLDTTPISEMQEDPLATENFRTPRLDLDCLYGQGPGAMPHLYDRTDPDTFFFGITSPSNNEVGAVIPNLPNDLPRNAQGHAIIGDPRNDENLIVAQLHVAMMKFHNAVVKVVRGEGVPAPKVFEESRRRVTWHYQWIVLNDFVARLVDTAILDDVVSFGRQFYDFDKWTFIPVEFSVAAYRLGHSMVRAEYDYNRVFNPSPARLAPGTFNFLFQFTGLSGGVNGVGLKSVPNNWIIDWQRFFELPPSTSTAPNKPTLNKSRKLDPFAMAGLHNLPNTPPPASLPVRNLLRGSRIGLPSGQAVAAQMGIPSLTPAQIATGTDGAVAAANGFDRTTPLWYYILKEAEVIANGQRLGPVGSRILAEVFVGLLEGDPHSFLSQAPEWVPTMPAVTPGAFTMSDLLTVVNEINPLGEP